MNQLLSNRLTVRVLVLAVSVLFPCAARMHGAARMRANEIPGGTIFTTLTIYEDSELTGDVNCTVPPTKPGANPCISFGADHIKLRLNGHTITGPVTPPTCTWRIHKITRRSASGKGRDSSASATGTTLLA